MYWGTHCTVCLEERPKLVVVSLASLRAGRTGQYPPPTPLLPAKTTKLELDPYSVPGSRMTRPGFHGVPSPID